MEVNNKETCQIMQTHQKDKCIRQSRGRSWLHFRSRTCADTMVPTGQQSRLNEGREVVQRLV